MANAMNINPTRMELLLLRKRLVLARRGHKLLKDKLDGLMRVFLEVQDDYRAHRREVDAELPQVLKGFVLAEATAPASTTREALDGLRRKLTVTPHTRRVMSVAAPRLEIALDPMAGGYSRLHTSPDLDGAVQGLERVFPKLLKLAELEEMVRLLAAEIARTRRRVNALEHTMIPRMTETAKYIASKLDENERSNTIRLLKIKEQRLIEARS